MHRLFCPLPSHHFRFCLIIVLPLSSLVLIGESDNNQSLKGFDVIRVLKPGIFELKTEDYLVRMRTWGVGFPNKNQPGYEQAFRFSEKWLLNHKVYPVIKIEFDSNNLKTAELFLGVDQKNFGQLAISEGHGWHLEKETGRYGVYVIAQVKAKRNELGIWRNGGNIPHPFSENSTGIPMLRSLTGKSMQKSSIKYWVTSMGKIHRHGCSFYERGKGVLSSRPTGSDCRICGGTNTGMKAR